jgi:AraC family transcriptional regulator of adaptative response/methylated-DNA-[protein]-cysteine methyltransferase
LAPDIRWNAGDAEVYFLTMKTMPTVDEMQRAYLASDAAFNGLFFLGVRTTGIFCRPTCPARKPLPRNVEYFASPDAALFAGYRPCKRCRPLELDEQPEWVSGLLAELDREPAARFTERSLRARGIDPATARRYFLKHYGMTFHAFGRARRLGGAFTRIREGAAIDDAVFDSGFDSHSGFRDAFSRVFGAPPGESREGECVLLSWMRTPLGPMVAGATEAGICLLEFTDRGMLESQLDSVKGLFDMALVPGTNGHLEKLQEELTSYFAGTLRQFTVPLVVAGTDFQERVWGELRRIPYGQTRSYEEIAAAVGAPKAVRAVGRTNGLNRIAIVIPCHRVVSKNGELCGYGGGLWRKKFMLDLEHRFL